MLALQAYLLRTGSQKVEGSNPSSSTKEAKEANQNSQYLSIRSKSCMQLAIPLDRLIEGFLLSCKVENKSPATISFYQNILNKFQWFLYKFDVEDTFFWANRKVSWLMIADQAFSTITSGSPLWIAGWPGLSPHTMDYHIGFKLVVQMSGIVR